MLFSESNNKEVIDWEAVLSDAIKTSHLDSHFKNQGWIWATCACGQQDARIQRNNIGEPKDRLLFIMGNDFSQYIEEGQYQEALETFYMIQERSAEILEQLENQI